LAIVLAAFNGKTPKDILEVNIEEYFERLDLLQHLSSTRGNGLKSMVKRIQDIAASL
jgi:cysteine desulfuration protein SufE